MSMTLTQKYSGIYIMSDEIVKYFSLFTTVSNENDTLIANIKNLNDYYSTDDQKVIYEEQQKQWFDAINLYLYFIFYALLIIFAVYFILKNTKYTILSKFIILICLLIFPFIIAPIEIVIYNFIIYIWSFLKLRSYNF
jgi:VIT1/CCC1 family predicted Fe2+/Mn2+ transporter